MTNKIKISGFSLIELSMVLAIIAVTLGGALTLATQKTQTSKINNTEYKIALIENALSAYLIKNKSLPCPADGTAIINNTNNNLYGIAGTVSERGCGYSNFNDGAYVYSGVVPTKTLGLADDIGIDGWGRRITYAIDFRFANNNITNASCNGVTNTNCFQYTSKGSITVNDSSGNLKTNEAVYILISHGKNGFGAFTYYGSKNRITFVKPYDNDEITNTGDKKPYNSIFIQKPTTESFDDIVHYNLKWQIVNDAGGITDPNLCIPAKNVVLNADNNSCLGATNLTSCQSLAAKINSLCLQ